MISIAANPNEKDAKRFIKEIEKSDLNLTTLDRVEIEELGEPWLFQKYVFEKRGNKIDKSFKNNWNEEWKF